MALNFRQITPPAHRIVEAGRFARFAAVGASGTILDVVLLSILKSLFSWATLPANIISYSCGIVNNYLLNSIWVYPETRGRQSLVQLLQFSLVSLVGLVLNNLLVLTLEEPAGLLLGNQAFGYLPAKIAATAIVLAWNFLANRLWTFRRQQKDKQQRDHTYIK